MKVLWLCIFMAASFLLTGCVASMQEPLFDDEMEDIDLSEMERKVSSIIIDKTDKCMEHTLEELSDWDLKIDKDCFIQWSDGVKKGDITPEDFINKEDYDAEDVIEEDSIIIFQTKSDFVDNVVFSHSIHQFWLGCNVCHYGRRIFIPLQGANPITMQKISNGQYCGVCHGPNANSDSFHLSSNESCPKCHSFKKEYSFSR